MKAESSRAGEGVKCRPEEKTVDRESGKKAGLLEPLLQVAIGRQGEGYKDKFENAAEYLKKAGAV